MCACAGCRRHVSPSWSLFSLAFFAVPIHHAGYGSRRCTPAEARDSLAATRVPDGRPSLKEKRHGHDVADGGLQDVLRLRRTRTSQWSRDFANLADARQEATRPLLVATSLMTSVGYPTMLATV